MDKLITNYTVLSAHSLRINSAQDLCEYTVDNIRVIIDCASQEPIVTPLDRSALSSVVYDSTNNYLTITLSDSSSPLTTTSGAKVTIKVDDGYEYLHDYTRQWETHNSIRSFMAKIKDTDTAYANRCIISGRTYDYVGVERTKNPDYDASVEGSELYIYAVKWMRSPSGATDPASRSWDTFRFTNARHGWGDSVEEEYKADSKLVYTDALLKHRYGEVSVSTWENTYLATSSDTDTLKSNENTHYNALRKLVTDILYPQLYIEDVAGEEESVCPFLCKEIINNNEYYRWSHPYNDYDFYTSVPEPTSSSQLYTYNDEEEFITVQSSEWVITRFSKSYIMDVIHAAQS